MIGVFDSGVGGLTVIKEFIKLMPEYDYLYLGDNARAPYGGRSEETIINYTREAVDFLFDKGASLIIFACNTASSVALRTLQEEFIRSQNEKGKNILGVVFPLVEKAIDVSKNNRIGVVGTRATIESNAYAFELKKLESKAMIFQKACPLLVPFIEEEWQDKPEASMILRKYLAKLKTCNIDTLILGCTHYPVMHNKFERIMGKNVHVFDTGIIAAESLKNYLEKHQEIESNLNRNSAIKFYTTGDKVRFKELASRFMKNNIREVEKVSLK